MDICRKVLFICFEVVGKMCSHIYLYESMFSSRCKGNTNIFVFPERMNHSPECTFVPTCEAQPSAVHWEPSKFACQLMKVFIHYTTDISMCGGATLCVSEKNLMEGKL